MPVATATFTTPSHDWLTTEGENSTPASPSGTPDGSIDVRLAGTRDQSTGSLNGVFSLKLRC